MTSGGFQLTVYLKRIREIIGFSYHYILLPLIILLILVFVLIRNRKKEHREWITSLIVPFFYCVAGAASVGALILSPIIMGKSWILAVCFLMIAIGQVYKEIRTDGYDIIKPVKAFLLILTFYSGIRESAGDHGCEGLSPDSVREYQQCHREYSQCVCGLRQLV